VTTLADRHLEVGGPIHRGTPRGFPGPLRPLGRVDLEAAERAVRALLEAIGADPAAESLADTPGRVAATLAELLTPLPFTPTTFPNDEGYDELVLARSIPFASLCQHHLLPFRGLAHVGYLPGDRVVGLSKLARVVEWFARDLQTQERLTEQVAGWLEEQLDPRGVGVVVDAEHLCMTVRGVQAPGVRTLTSARAAGSAMTPGPGPSSSPWPRR
jgi:GTP cyclohydrolase IA